MSEWISVKDRMPEKEGKYIVCKSGNVYALPMRINGLGHKYWEAGKYFKKETDKVSHWMPFPEPPNEDDKNRSLRVCKSRTCDFCNDIICSLDKGEPHDFQLYGDALYYFDSQNGWEGIKIKYCPMCGAKLEQ